MTGDKTREKLLPEKEQLCERLVEAEEILKAMRSDMVSAIVVSGQEGKKVYTLDRGARTSRILVEALSEGTVLLSPDGRIFCCNGRFAQMVDFDNLKFPHL